MVAPLEPAILKRSYLFWITVVGNLFHMNDFPVISVPYTSIRNHYNNFFKDTQDILII